MLVSKIFFSTGFFFYSELNHVIFSNGAIFFKYKYHSNFYFLKKKQFLFIFLYFFVYTMSFDSIKYNIRILCKCVNNLMFYQSNYFKLEGRGYKLYNYLNFVICKLGYSHLCYYLLPFNMLFISRKKKAYHILVSHDKFMMGHVIKNLYSFRMPSKYKRKGIFIS